MAVSINGVLQASHSYKQDSFADSQERKKKVENRNMKTQTKLLFTSMLALAAALNVEFASAGPLVSGGGIGDSKVYVQCASRTRSLIVRGTAYPGHFQGLMDTKPNMHSTFNCVKDGSNLIPNVPSAGRLLWVCNEESQQVDQQMMIRIEATAQGAILGNVMQAQMFPMPPVLVEAMLCRISK
jgi:hypothetical protein